MTTSETGTPIPLEDEAADDDLDDAIRHYVYTYALWRGRPKAMERFGVSRHTLWRFLDRGHMGRALPRAVLDTVGDSIEVIDAATWAIGALERISASFERSARNRRPAGPSLRRGQEDALLQLCAAPLTTVSELARFNREPPTTLRGRLVRGWRNWDWRIPCPTGWAPSVRKPQRRYFPTEHRASTPPRRLSRASGESWPSSRCPASGSACWPNASTPWPCSTTSPPSIADADPEGDHGAGGPPPPGTLRPAGYSVTRPLRGHPAPGSDPALGPPALPPEDHREPAGEPAASGDAGDHRLRAGHPPGHTHLGAPGGARDLLRRHRGRATGRGPPGRGVAAVRARDGDGGEDGNPASPWRTSSPPPAGWRTGTPGISATGPRRPGAKPNPGPLFPLPQPPAGRHARPNRSRSEAPWPCSSPAPRRRPWTCWPPGPCAPPTNWPG